MIGLLRSLGTSAALLVTACGDARPQISVGVVGDAASHTAPTADDESTGDAADAGLHARTDAHVDVPDAGSEGGSTESPASSAPLDPHDPLLGGTPPPSPAASCGKIDFLFVIDNSGSMADEQQNLIRSFPGFLDTIRRSVAASDHHVLVTDTGIGGGSSQSSTCSGDACTCTPAGTCCQSICASHPDGTCNGTSCRSPVMATALCDAQLGAGRVKDFTQMRCLPDDPRYITSDAADLATKFSCVARVGTGGDSTERPMQAIVEAVGPLATAGQCNEGFLRDDAILVVTFITDEEDAPGKSAGDPPDWVASLVAAKHGNQAAIVMLGVFGDSDRPNSTCAPGGLMGDLGADPGPRLRAFVESFEHGVAGSVCAPDYAPFFDQAVQVIDAACDEFTQ